MQGSDLDREEPMPPFHQQILLPGGNQHLFDAVVHLEGPAPFTARHQANRYHPLLLGSGDVDCEGQSSGILIDPDPILLAQTGGDEGQFGSLRSQLEGMEWLGCIRQAFLRYRAGKGVSRKRIVGGLSGRVNKPQ